MIVYVFVTGHRSEDQVERLKFKGKVSKISEFSERFEKCL